MKHQFFFSGYSDDVVLAGRDKASFDEHYATYFLISNGIVIQARYGNNGWEIGLTEEHNADITIIPAADMNDDGIEHSDLRIPEWFSAPGYAPVLIIESDEPLEIVAQGNDRNAFYGATPEFIRAAKLRKAVIAAAEDESGFDEDEMPSVEAFISALKKLNF